MARRAGGEGIVLHGGGADQDAILVLHFRSNLEAAFVQLVQPGGRDFVQSLNTVHTITLFYVIGAAMSAASVLPVKRLDKIAQLFNALHRLGVVVGAKFASLGTLWQVFLAAIPCASSPHGDPLRGAPMGAPSVRFIEGLDKVAELFHAFDGHSVIDRSPHPAGSSGGPSD